MEFKKGQKSRPVVVKFRTIMPIAFSDPEFGGVNVDLISYGRASLTINDLSTFKAINNDYERTLEEMGNSFLAKVLASYSGMMPSAKLQYIKDEIAKKFGYMMNDAGVIANNVDIVDISYTDEYKKLIPIWREQGFVSPVPQKQSAPPASPAPAPAPAEEPVPDRCPACGSEKVPGTNFCDKCGYKY